MADYYVTTPGNGGSDSADGSIGTPWATLSHACSVVSGVGDVIHVAAGSYTDNTQAVLAVGVKISGAGQATTTINTTASPYILAKTSVPVVDGSNEISGLTLNGGDSAAVALRSAGRSNQVIHDCIFANFTGSGVELYGKYGRDDTGGGFWDNTGVNPTYTGTWRFDDVSLSVEPISTDWAEDCELYNCTFNDAKLMPACLKSASIHDNVWNNDGTYGSKRSAVGHTGFWFRTLRFYNNEINIGDMSTTIIAVELWENADECEFYSNTSDSWFSLRGSTFGLTAGFNYNYLFYDNAFVANYTPTNAQEALEVMSDIQAALIYDNYFEGSAWRYGIAVWTSVSGSNKTGDDILHDITIHHNVFNGITNADSYGAVHLEAGYANTDIDTVLIYNNVFDGNRQGVNLGYTDAGAVMTGVEIKNNIFINHVHRAVVANGAGMDTYYVDYNYQYNNAAPWLADNAGKVSQSNTTNAEPDLNYSGDRPDPYYRPTDEANVIDAGIDVGLAYTGSAPDIGVFEESLVLVPTHTSAYRVF